MSTARKSAQDKAARLAAARRPATEATEAAPAQERPQGAPPVAVEQRPSPAAMRVKPVRMTLDLMPELHADLTAWCAGTARELGRGKVNGSDVLRVLIRRLLADEAVAAEVREALRQEGR